MCDQFAQMPSGKVPKNAQVMSAPCVAAGAVAAADASAAACSISPPPTPTDEKLERRTRRLKRMRKKAPDVLKVLMCVTDCKYDVVKEAARARGWKLVVENGDTTGAVGRKCHVYWVDMPIIVERMQQLQPWQRINHFPGMSNVARKGRLAQNLDRLRRSFPQEFSFYPRTWVLPAEWSNFKTEFDASGKSTRIFIIKPDSGCQGKGIFLTQDLERVASMESQVAQVYVRKPLLIEGFKFDLRVYVLVTSVIPLRVYVFKDGLARFCTEEYLRPTSENLGERCMHLTNYAVNKRSDNFVNNDAADRDDRGSKRSLRWLLRWIAAEHGEKRADLLWKKICSACVKTLISILPTLHREYLHTFGPDKQDVRDTNYNSDDDGGDGYRNRETAGCDDEPRSGPSLAHRGNDSTGRTRKESDSSSGICSEASEGRVGGSDKGLRFRGQGNGQPPMAEETACSREGEGNRVDKTIPCEEDQDKDGGGATKGGDNGCSSTGGRRKTADGMVEGSRCVEILGFDFMIDAVLKPWLIEVNHLPSFATDSPLDLSIKSQVVETALAVLRAKANDRKSYEENSKRDSKNRLYNAESLGLRSLSRTQERKDAEDMVAKIRKKVETIYMRFAPQKVSKVGGLLLRYAGKEEKLLRLVHRKYVKPAGAGLNHTPHGQGESGNNAEGDDGAVEPSAPSHGSGRAVTTDEEQLLNLQSNFLHDHDADSQNNGVRSPVSPKNGHRCETPREEGEEEQCRPLLSEESSLGKTTVDCAPSTRKCSSSTREVWQEATAVKTESGKSTPERADEKEGTTTGVRSTLPQAASPPLWAIADDPECLEREGSLLVGWERVHPSSGPRERPQNYPSQEQSDRLRSIDTPPTQAEADQSPTEKAPGDMSGRDGGGDGSSNAEEGRVDKREKRDWADSGGRGKGSGLGKKRRSAAAVSVDAMIRRAFEDDLKTTMRLKCPLQQTRGGAMDPQATKLPLVGQSATPSSPAKKNQAVSAILGPEQRQKAQRLMEGYSSGRRRSASAPSKGGGDIKSQLPVSLRVAVVRAKEWRRRRDQENARRASQLIPVKIHTFSFDAPSSGGQA